MKNTKQTSVHSALWILRISQFCNSFIPCLPIIALISVKKGITVGDFLLLEGIFRIVTFAFEIPSGYMSDRFSRKNVLLLATFAHCVGFTLFAFAYGFWQIALAQGILGIGTALFSGTLEAYTYDLLKRDKTEHTFLKEMGSISTYSSASTFIAVLIGPVIYLATKENANLLINITAITVFIGLLLSFKLPNLTEVIRKKQKNKSAFMDALGITYNTLKNPKLSSLIIFPALFGSLSIVMFWLLQPIMENSKIPVYLFGIYVGINNFSRIVFSKYAYKICRKFGEINTSILTILTLVLWVMMSFVALYTKNMYITYIAVAIMACIPATQKLNDLQYNTLIHDDIESKERGTVLSTRAMVSTLFGAATLATSRQLFDHYGIEVTVLTLLFATILLVISLKQTKKYICNK